MISYIYKNHISDCSDVEDGFSEFTPLILLKPGSHIIA